MQIGARRPPAAETLNGPLKVKEAHPDLVPVRNQQ
jgi:hypothetical protein